MTEINEEWRPIPGYEGIYSVSSEGRVRRDKAAKNSSSGKILAPTWNTKHELVCLHRDGYGRLFRVDHFVALAFIGPKPPDLDVNHKSGLMWDDRAENLEYVTRAENIRRARAGSVIDEPLKKTLVMSRNEQESLPPDDGFKLDAADMMGFGDDEYISNDDQTDVPDPNSLEAFRGIDEVERRIGRVHRRGKEN